MDDNTNTKPCPVHTACFVTDEGLQRRVRDALAGENAACEGFKSETALMRACRYRNFDLIVVGPGKALEVEERLLSWLSCRAEQDAPVILLLPNCSAENTARALEAGADDVVREDVDPAELMARAHSVLRRYDRRLDHHARIDMMGFTFDRETGSCLDRGEPVSLRPREFAMAWLLFCNRGRYLTRGTISAALWGANDAITSRTIEQHVYKLRKKLRLGADRGVTIRTGYAHGYRLEICGDESRARRGLEEVLSCS